MYSRFSISRVLCSSVLVISLAVLAFGDTIRLKDGSIIKGKIVSFTGGKFVVAIGEGARKREMSFTATEIESIQFDSPMVQAPVAYREPRSNPSRPTLGDTDANEPVDEQEPEIVESEPEPLQTVPPPRIPQPSPRVNNPAPQNTQRPAFGAKPVEISVKVLADNTSNGWTNSGWVVKKGQRIRITGSGEVSLGNGRRTAPSGLPELADEGKLLKSVATGALIAVIGDDNNEFIYIGAEREFTAARDGALFLGVNEGNLNDNSGSFAVKVEITPDGR